MVENGAAAIWSARSATDYRRRKPRHPPPRHRHQRCHVKQARPHIRAGSGIGQAITRKRRTGDDGQQDPDALHDPRRRSGFRHDRDGSGQHKGTWLGVVLKRHSLRMTRKTCRRHEGIASFWRRWPQNFASAWPAIFRSAPWMCSLPATHGPASLKMSCLPFAVGRKSARPSRTMNDARGHVPGCQSIFPESVQAGRRPHRPGAMRRTGGAGRRRSRPWRCAGRTSARP